jgi:5-(carboxyamino)imidazole ribonucleotide mutase
MAGNLMGGLDSLLSIVQMPRGVPVATVGVGNAENAAILAAQILGLKDQNVRDRVVAYRAAQTQAIVDDPSNRQQIG